MNKQLKSIDDTLQDQIQHKKHVLQQLNRHPFKPACWLPGGHLQTGFGPILGAKFEFQFEHEQWELPDGDCVHVYWHQGDSGAPMVCVLHGLEGCHRSHYIQRLNHLLQKQGWGVCLFEYRSCSGEPNRLPRFYHIGDTGDFDIVLRRFREKWPENPLFAIGYSLGGNILGKWLGEQGSQAQTLLQAASILSAPYLPRSSGDYLERPA